MNRAKFTTHGSGALTLEYVDVLTGAPQCRTFFTKGGNVYEHLGFEGRHRQVCEKLYASGNTLKSGDEDLSDVVRREYQRMRKSGLRAMKA